MREETVQEESFTTRRVLSLNSNVVNSDGLILMTRDKWSTIEFTNQMLKDGLSNVEY